MDRRARATMVQRASLGCQDWMAPRGPRDTRVRLASQEGMGTGGKREKRARQGLAGIQGLRGLR